MKCARSILLALCLLAVGCSCAVGAIVPGEGKMLALLDSNVGGTEYILSVRFVSLKGGSGKQVFEIRCAACARHVLLHEETLDYPISIYRTSDDSPLFFTLWTTGSGYRIRVFYIDSNMARSVLDVGATAPPQVFRDHSNHLLVSIVNRFRSSQSGSIRSSPSTVYRWNGTVFQLVTEQQR